MKWIGQQIYDQISRFRSDIYLEGISASTETDMLVVDSNNKVSKRAIDAITVDVSDFLTDGADNRVVTATGTDALLAETYLTFQNTGNVSTLSLLSDQDTGDLLSIATTTHGATTLTTTDDDATAAHFEIAADGDITLDAAGDIALEAGGNDIAVDTDNFVITSATSQKPFLELKNTTNNNKGSTLQFTKDKGAAGADGDTIGIINFVGDDAAETQTSFAQITAQVSEADDTDEAGKLTLSVAESDGTNTQLTAGLVLEGEHATDGEVDVTIAAGAASLTTIAGTLTMGSTATLDNSGVIQVASQPNITTLAGLTSLGSAGAITNFLAGDVTIYNAVNNGNPYFAIGSVSTESLRISAIYNSGTQAFDSAKFETFSSDTDANEGRYHFHVDGSSILSIKDTGLNLVGSMNLSIGGIDIIADSSGTTTLSNIDALDATTEATVEAAIDTLANLTSIGAAGVTTNIVAGDVTMYNAVNNGNPTISLGSSATNRLEIASVYNSGAQTLCDIDFTTYTASGTNNDGRFNFYVDEVLLSTLNDAGLYIYGTGTVQAQGDGATLTALDETTSSATEGGKLRLMNDDGAAMGDDHRIGVIDFLGAEDGSGTKTIGASIEAFCDAAWSASENGGRLVFSTTDGNASTSTVLTLDSDKLATFTGPIACTTRTLATSSTVDGNANGDVAYFGGTTSMTVGKIYHYKSDGTWEIANADAVATSDGLLGVALGAASDTNGMLLRGFVTLDHDPGAIGDVLYVQSDNAGVPGNASATAPAVSGDCVRIIGYQVLHASNGNVWFNPDNTFVEVA